VEVYGQETPRGAASVDESSSGFISVFFLKKFREATRRCKHARKFFQFFQSFVFEKNLFYFMHFFEDCCFNSIEKATWRCKHGPMSFGALIRFQGLSFRV
jgi:hypothetical protein